MIGKLITFYNWLRGYGFSWIETPGSPAGGYIDAWPGTCPYPCHKWDWSAKGCIRRGDCGCVNGKRDA